MIIVKAGRVQRYLKRVDDPQPAAPVYIDADIVHASFNIGDETAHLQVVIGPSLGEGTGSGLSTSPASSRGRRSASPPAGRGLARLEGEVHRQVAIRAFLRSTGLPEGDLHDLPDSPKRFPDGAQYRVEIPSTEGPRCLEAVLEEADRLDVRVHRVSQGSGVFMQTDAELDEMARAARRGADRGVALRAAERGLGAVGDRAGARRLRRRGARPGAGGREPRGLRARGRARLPLGPDRRRRRARPSSARRGTPGLLPATCRRRSR